MAKKLTKERFSVYSAVRRFHIYKELRDCLVSHNQANLHTSSLLMHRDISISSQLHQQADGTHKLICLYVCMCISVCGTCHTAVLYNQKILRAVTDIKQISLEV